MQAASARHNDQQRMRRPGETLNERARESQRWRHMLNKHAAQPYSKGCFKGHLRIVMPCRVRKLSSQVGKGHGISVARQNS